jgi:hypothetical protein
MRGVRFFLTCAFIEREDRCVVVVANGIICSCGQLRYTLKLRPRGMHEAPIFMLQATRQHIEGEKPPDIVPIPADLRKKDYEIYCSVICGHSPASNTFVLWTKG